MDTNRAVTPSLFTFGCMSLGSDLAKIEDHIHITRTAMDAGVWFHASPTYNRGFTYMILRMAFDEARHLVPPMIVKIRCGSEKLLRFEVEDALRRMGLERIEVAQLVFTETGGAAPLVHDFLTGGPIAEACGNLRREGKVAQFCPQVDLESSRAFLPLAERKAFDGYVLYLNPLQRDVDDALWSVMQKQGAPLWALRTLAGALGEPSKLNQLRMKDPNDRNLQLAEPAAAIAAKAGVTDWTEFCIRYAAGIPGLRTTIGGTADLGHLKQFLTATGKAVPLPGEVMAEIDLARREGLDRSMQR